LQTQKLLRPLSVSVGICAVTEVENTLQLVGQILTMQTPNLSLEELIVATPNLTLASKLDSPDHRLTIILEKEREGKASALRKILRRATGDILVLASSDIKLGVHSIGYLVNALASHETWGAVDSHVEVINGETHFIDRVSILLWEVHNETLDLLDDEGRLGHVAGDLLAVKRDLLSEIPNVINDDAYIALSIQRKGFLVRRVKNALVWIMGPRNPADYVAQRSRVLQGHLQTIRDLRVMPTTFEFTLVWNPLRNIRILRLVLSRLGASYMPTLFTALILELVSFQAALLRMILRRKYGPWRIVESTKRV
jgi:cellulose synthase/poly-beta-1,6-N-acetylglucosamine synthase-like glycosyltransferase